MSLSHAEQAPQAENPPGLTPRDILGPGGLLAQIKPNFEVRPGQLEASERIFEAIRQGDSLNIEAGTGVGKGYMYLAAIVASGQPAIIATSTTVLQDQLLSHDIPDLNAALKPTGRHLTAAKLKGIGRYPCLYEIDRVKSELQQQDIFISPESFRQLPELLNWISELEHVGEIADLDLYPHAITDDLKAAVTTDHESCLRQACTFVKRCHAMRARAQAKEAHVIIVNQTLQLLNGLYGFLPARHLVVIDEAHELEAAATNVSGIDLSEGKWVYRERRGAALEERTKALMSTLQPVTDAIPGSADELLRHIDRPADEPLLGTMQEAALAGKNATREARHQFQSWLDGMKKARKAHIPETRHDLEAATKAWAEKASEVARILARRVASYGQLSDDEDGADEAEPDPWRSCAQAWRQYADAVGSLVHDLTRVLHPPDGLITYLERVSARRRPRVNLCGELLSVAEWLQTYLWGLHDVITCSATLALYDQAKGGMTMTFWKFRVGNNAPELIVGSPFDYWQQARLYWPREAKAFDPSRQPNESTEAYNARMAAYQGRITEEIIALLQASQGRALGLFTSKEAVDRTAEALHGRVPWTILRQGQYPKAELLKRFSEDIHSVLLGTKGFWQGIDVPGEALSLVIIDKLPFEVPDDPTHEARVRDITQREGFSVAWNRFILPSMLTIVRQGAGRLIRRTTDRGVISILDGRLSTKGYGVQVIRSLPRMPQIRTIAEVQRFFEEGR